MDVTRTEEEQIEALRKWWAENGWAIVGGVVIGLGAIFGWRSWQTYQLAQAEQASDIYSTMVVDVRTNKTDQARTNGNRLLEEFPNTAYATFAAMMLGKLDVEAENLESAQTHLQWVMDNAKQKELKLLARIRMSQVLLASGKPEEALKLLENTNAGKFTASYEETKGDIYMELNNLDAARTAYQLALASGDNNVQNESFLDMKIDALGRQTP